MRAQPPPPIPPSQPSPFSPELQTFILTKFDPLLTIVRELNDRLQAAEKDRFRLERRVARLEDHVKCLQSGEPVPPDEIREDLRPLDTGTILAGEEALKGPWLFSCQSGTPTASLQALLEFTPETTEELDVREWNSEEDMWIAFLEDLPIAVPYSQLHYEQSLDLMSLRKAARYALIQLCKSEYLLILRQTPGRTEASRNRQAITLVAIIAAALSEAWNRVERTEPSTLGRIALVLEGDDVGTRLRAGRTKFVIEPLN